MVAAAAATGFLSLPGAGASAMTDDQEQPGGSAGVLSGNSIAAPLSVPVNLCGNTVDAAAAANPATGNTCANASGATATQAQERQEASGYGQSETGAAAPAPSADTTQATSSTHSSGGILSGNTVQAPVDVGLNLCGDSVDVVGALNSVTGASCSSNGEATAQPESPGHEVPAPGPGAPVVPPTGRSGPVPQQAGPAQPPAKQAVASTAHVPMGYQAPVARAQLADTGVDQNLLAAAAASAALLVGGGILYRRAGAHGS